MDYEQAMAYNTGFSSSTQTVRTNSLFPYFGGKTRGVSKVDNFMEIKRVDKNKINLRDKLTN